MRGNPRENKPDRRPACAGRQRQPPSCARKTLLETPPWEVGCRGVLLLPCVLCRRRYNRIWAWSGSHVEGVSARQRFAQQSRKNDMTFAMGFWILLAGGVMVPGGDDPLAISAPIRTDDYSPSFTLPSSKKSDGSLPTRSAAGGSSAPSRYAAGSAVSRYRGAPMGRTFGQGGYSRTSSTMPRMVMPLAPTDAGTTGFMPAPPTAASPSSPGMYGRRGAAAIGTGRTPNAFSGLGKMPASPYGSSFTAAGALPAHFGSAGQPLGSRQGV